MTTHRRRWTRALLIGVAAVGASACTTVLDHPVKAVQGYAPAQRIDMKVALVLSDELRQARWERSAGGETVVLPFGEHLATNSENVARALFSGVTVQTSPGPVPPEAAGLLVPRMVFIEQSFGIWVWDDANITMGLEWTFKDRDGRVVWVDTVKGTGTNATGNLFTSRTRMTERAGLVIEDVFRKSFDAIAGARALRDFAARK